MPFVFVRQAHQGKGLLKVSGQGHCVSTQNRVLSEYLASLVPRVRVASHHYEMAAFIERGCRRRRALKALHYPVGGGTWAYDQRGGSVPASPPLR